METLTASYGEWLTTFHWDFWLTLTTDYPTAKNTLIRKFDGWISALESAGQGRVDYVRALETTAVGEWHVHALLRTPPRRMRVDSDLLALPDLMGPEHLARKWKHGRTDVQVYDAARGAALYLAKYYGHDGDGSEYAERLLLPA